MASWNIRMYAGIRRARLSSEAMAGAVQIRQFSSSACPCVVSESRSSGPFPSVFRPMRPPNGILPGTQSDVASNLSTDGNYNTVLVRRRQHCLQTTGPKSGFFSGSMFCELSLAIAGRSASKAVWTPVRCMGSSKVKEQPRGSLWRTRSVISKETVQAVHDLKRNKHSPEDLDRIFATRIPRMLKMDLLATLNELQRQSEIALVLRLFDVVKKEIWYKPDLFLYRSVIDTLAKNHLIDEVEKKYQEMQAEGIQPNVVIYRELVGAYVRMQMLDKAFEIHAKMESLGCGDDRFTLHFLEMGKNKREVLLRQKQRAEEKRAQQENSLRNVSDVGERDSVGVVSELEEQSMGVVSDMEERDSLRDVCELEQQNSVADVSEIEEPNLGGVQALS